MEVCPLINLPASQVPLVRQGRVSRFAALPALEDETLAADLDRVMTIEKGLLASMTDQRKKGVVSEAEGQILTDIFGRKRTRAALPDDFTAAVARMRDRILDKHGRASSEEIPTRREGDLWFVRCLTG